MRTKIANCDQETFDNSVKELLRKYRGNNVRILFEFDPDSKPIFLEVSAPTTVFRKVESVQFSE